MLTIRVPVIWSQSTRGAELTVIIISTIQLQLQLKELGGLRDY